MKFKSRVDLICCDEDFDDIHDLKFLDVKSEMRIFVKEVLENQESSGQDSYPFTYLFRHSFKVLNQILEEYFKDNWW